jgi:hypothetical protein
MANSTPEKFIVEMVDNFIVDGVSATQNGLLHALAIWLDNNIQGELVQKRKQEAGGEFYEFVTNFVAQRSYERKKWIESPKIPSSKNERKKSLEFSSRILTQINGLPFEQGLEFIANLYAAWILSCPANIIMTSSEYKGTISTENETELTEQLLRYLDFLLTHRN